MFSLEGLRVGGGLPVQPAAVRVGRRGVGKYWEAVDGVDRTDAHEYMVNVYRHWT